MERFALVSSYSVGVACIVCVTDAARIGEGRARRHVCVSTATPFGMMGVS